MPVIYTVEVYSSTQFTTESISIKLIGTKCDTKPQRLSTFSLFGRKPKISCPESVGDVLMVELEATESFWVLIVKAWFCSKIVINTPEGERIQFPCYQYLDNKNPVVHLLRDKAFICVSRTNDKLHPKLLSQRQQEIKKRKEIYKWGEYLHGLPWIIDAASPSDLPGEDRFSFTKEIHSIYNFTSAYTELGIETLIHCHDSWKNLDELLPLLKCHHNKITDYISEHWDEDEFFGYQLLNGLNPMMIERCSKLPPNFPVTDEMVQFAFPGSSLTQQMKKGNIFICDYKRLSGLVGNVINKEQQYVASPLCLLFSDKGKLIPIAIQLQQNPGEKNPIFLANEPNKWDWILAKTFVRGAEFFEHELNFHLLRAHLLAEVFTISTMRNLPSSHPLFKLLLPHTRCTLHLNIMARKTLISDGGIFSKFTALGYDESNKFLQKAASTLTYSSLCLPDNIKERGLENIPNYYYRDDGLKLWNIIHKFVDGLLKIYYKSDEDVTEDRELHNWIHEIYFHGFQGDEKTGIPRSFSKLDEVIKFVTMIIFTVSAQHTALNDPQYEFGSWMPSLPTSLRRPPPSEKGKATKQSFMQTLPTVSITTNGLTILHVLSSKSSEDNLLGDYKEELFGEKEAQQHMTKFKKDRMELSRHITSRNDGMELPYKYLHPGFISESVSMR